MLSTNTRTSDRQRRWRGVQFRSPAGHIQVEQGYAHGGWRQERKGPSGLNTMCEVGFGR
jgi:hypothetical protein